MKRFLLLFVTICFCFVFAVPAFATYENPDGSSYHYMNGNIQSSTNYWTATSESLYQIAYRLPYGSNFLYYSGSSSSSSTTFWVAITNSLRYIGDDTRIIRSNIVSLESKTDTIISYLGDLKTYTDQIETYIDGIETTLTTISSRINTTNSRLNTTNTHLDSIKSFLSDIHDVIANTTDKNLRNNQEANIVQASSDFLSGTASATSVGVGNISSVKSTFGSAQSFFGMGEGIDVFGSLNDQSSSGPWVWFSQAVADDMDTVQTRRDEVYIDFLSEKYNDLNSRLGGDEGDNR